MAESRPRILFVTLADEMHASSRVRVFQYIRHFERAGMRCRVLPVWPTAALGLPRYVPRRARASLSYPLRVLNAIHAAAQYDIVYVNVVLLPVWVQDAIRERNPNVVFDFVDPVYASSRTPAARDASGTTRFEHMIETAAAVVTGNDTGRALAASKCRRVLNVVGPIDTERYIPRSSRQDNDHVVIGWIGTSATTRYLAVVKEALACVLAAYPNARLELIGARNAPLDGIAHKCRAWALDTEVSDLHRFDIGIMPLPDDPWTRGKGGYKLLQYMALGIPSVASPVGINNELVRDGETGFLASGTGAWVEHLGRLIRDEQLRRRLGSAARRCAETHYSLANSVGPMLELFNEVAGTSGDKSGAKTNLVSGAPSSGSRSSRLLPE